MNIELPLDGTARDRLRRASRTLFGNMHVLEALLVVGEDRSDVFYQAGLADRLGCKPNQAATVIAKLLELGVVERTPREEGQSRDYYRRLPTALWESMVPYARELLQSQDGHTAVAKLADRRQ